MNKTDLINVIAAESGLSKADTAKALAAFENIVADSLKRGEDVQLVGFGTFTVVERAERQGRNPATGETITIPAARQAKFKAGKPLRDALKQ